MNQTLRILWVVFSAMVLLGWGCGAVVLGFWWVLEVVDNPRAVWSIGSGAIWLVLLGWAVALSSWWPYAQQVVRGDATEGE